MQFEPLVRGARLGVYRTESEEAAIKQLRVLRYNPSDNWGSPTMTTLAELDELVGGPVEELLSAHGALAIGEKSEVLGVAGETSRLHGQTMPVLSCRCLHTQSPACCRLFGTFRSPDGGFGYQSLPCAAAKECWPG